MLRFATMGLTRLALLAAFFPRPVQKVPQPVTTERLSRDEVSGLFAKELGYR